MVQTVEFDLKQSVVRNDTFGPREVRQMQEVIARDFSQYAVLRDAVNELQSREEHTPASNVRLGVCLYLLGRYFRAIEILKQGDGGAMAHYYLAKCHFARQAYTEAIESYKAAERAGYNAGDCALGRAEALRYASDPTAALAVLDSLSGSRADGRIPGPTRRHGGRLGQQSARGRGPFRAGRRGQPQPFRRLFGLALENDRRGNDETAMEL